MLAPAMAASPAMRWRRVLWGLLAFGLIAGGVVAFLAIPLTTNQRIDFAGAAFGAFIAAATALGVVEFQARREAGRVWRVVDHLLFDAQTLAEDYLNATHNDRRQFSTMVALAAALDTAATISTDHQHHSIAMARVAHSLRAMGSIAEQAHAIGRLEGVKDQDAVDMIEAARDAIFKCRQMLLTNSRPA